MANKTINLRADLVERFEALAQAEGRTLDEVFGELLEQYSKPAQKNWALAVAEGMEAEDIDWLDDQDASTNSRQNFEQHLREKWRHTQNSDAD